MGRGKIIRYSMATWLLTWQSNAIILIRGVSIHMICGIRPNAWHSVALDVVCCCGMVVWCQLRFADVAPDHYVAGLTHGIVVRLTRESWHNFMLMIYCSIWKFMEHFASLIISRSIENTTNCKCRGPTANPFLINFIYLLFLILKT